MSVARPAQVANLRYRMPSRILEWGGAYGAMSCLSEHHSFKWT